MDGLRDLPAADRCARLHDRAAEGRGAHRLRAFVERELRLTAAAGFSLPDLGGDAREPREFVSTYVDTPDRRLLRHGITLRCHVEHRTTTWQLKLPRDGGRRELEEDGDGEAPPEPLAALLLGILRGHALAPLAELRTRRRRVRIRNGGAVVDVVLDLVEVPGEPDRGFAEIALELVEGDPGGLRRIERRLLAAGASRTVGAPAIARVLAAAERPPAPGGHVGASFDARVALLLAHDPGTRLGRDAEDLHQLRVATRRLRALLRGVRPLVDAEWADRLRVELKGIGAAAGRVRDLDVLIERLAGEIEALDLEDREHAEPLLTLLHADREPARADLLALMEGEGYLRLLDELEAGVVAPAPVRRRDLESIARREFRKTCARARRLPHEPDDASLHALRIQVKRARYAAELLGGARAKRLVARARALQDTLGDNQDAVVAEARIRELAARVPSDGAAAGIAAGRLLERERERRRRARADFPAGWRAFEAAGRRAWP